ncbi:helix-turn-helix domain-containing protein [Holdemania massiliensis]|uniref:helix-turn-helix domain-containing protein n=1 Tax=Holdemania massiliensis TaxID=1468449 RepID=UPI001F067594|nr:helix-turn-helix transcriptional regulator [Holdemania massiliensis]MCH1939887.1 helix-turn-helix domain-containing protein [Holdemania massiliensis]
MNHVNYAALGKRIRAIRRHRQMTQEQLAEAAGLSIPHLSNVENASTKLSLPKLTDIANALEVSLDELAGDSLKIKHVRPDIEELDDKP